MKAPTSMIRASLQCVRRQLVEQKETAPTEVGAVSIPRR